MTAEQEKVLDGLRNEYDIIKPVDGDKFLIRRDDLWGLFSVSTNRLVIPVEYHVITPVNSDKFWVRKNDLWGMFSISANRLVIPVEYNDGISQFDDDKFWVRHNGRLGLFSISANRLVIPVEYHIINHLGDNKFSVIKDGLLRTIGLQ